MNGRHIVVLAAFALVASGCGATAAEMPSEPSFALSANAPVSQIVGGGTVAFSTGRVATGFRGSLNGAGEVSGFFETHFQFSNGEEDYTLRGDVTCLQFGFSGPFALLVGRVTSSTNPGIPVGTLASWAARDNGEGSKATGPDLVSNLRLSPPQQNPCPYSASGINEWNTGNVQIW